MTSLGPKGTSVEGYLRARRAILPAETTLVAMTALSRSITANGAIPAAKAAAGESCLTIMSCAHLERYGTMAATVSFFLMVFQSIVAPLPAFLITFANANLFGWWRGAILSWSSVMCACPDNGP